MGKDGSSDAGKGEKGKNELVEGHITDDRFDGF